MAGQYSGRIRLCTYDPTTQRFFFADPTCLSDLPTYIMDSIFMLSIFTRYSFQHLQVPQHNTTQRNATCNLHHNNVGPGDYPTSDIWRPCCTWNPSWPPLPRIIMLYLLQLATWSTSRMCVLISCPQSLLVMLTRCRPRACRLLSVDLFK